jgi:glycine/D-amino acid oxidase-like deaminating enzyme
MPPKRIRSRLGSDRLRKPRRKKHMKIARRQFLKTLGAATVLGGPLKNAPKKTGDKRMSETGNYDVAVIGAGVFGSWTTYCLRKSGAKVLLLDEYGPANARASSGGESRIIRMGYGADEIYTRWSLHALPLWQKLLAEAGQPGLFQPTGVLWIARDQDPYSLASVATMQQAGAKFEKLALDDLRRRFPQIFFEDGAWGIFEPNSGVLMARRAVQAVVEQAQKLGVTYVRGAALTPAGRGNLPAIKTASGETIAAHSFVFACGPWLPKVFPDLLGSRIFPSRQEVLFFGIPPGNSQFSVPAMPTWIDMKDGFYGMPDLRKIYGASLPHPGRRAGDRIARLPVRKHIQRGFFNRSPSGLRQRVARRRRFRPRFQARPVARRICGSAGPARKRINAGESRTSLFARHQTVHAKPRCALISCAAPGVTVSMQRRGLQRGIASQAAHTATSAQFPAPLFARRAQKASPRTAARAPCRQSISLRISTCACSRRAESRKG